MSPPDLPPDRREGLFDSDAGPRVSSSGIESESRPPAPLAERMRPRDWNEVLGQEHLTAPEAPLRKLHAEGKLVSVILWGPPGSGKTTLATLLSDLLGHAAERFSAVLSGVRNVREVVERARERWQGERVKTILFVDEIHRFNRAQQDAFLPHVESGRIVLVGATTENPSFELIPPLLSRCAVHLLKPLADEQLKALGTRALKDRERGLGSSPMEVPADGWEILLAHAELDARRMLGALEMLCSATRPDADGVRRPGAAWIARVCERGIGLPIGREQHFDLISAFIKSLRGSDPHAALYWLARMIESGEEPRYIARRMVRFASEDVGLADASALHHANAAAAAYEFIGAPEGHLALAQAALHLALCAKSNSVYESYGRAAAMARDLGPLGVPLKIRNAPTELMERLGYGSGYRYPHAEPGRWVEESYLPEGVPEDRRRPYVPSDQGREAEIVRAHDRRTGGFYRLLPQRPPEDSASRDEGGD
ncbi:MAG: replication-associated recombination protein A [Candidatus Eisenbacteria bacterium]|nr:replication-associated recombination protein A [Candidatus Eisenbacteria bacterium]